MRAKSTQFGAKYLPPSPFAKLKLGPFELDSGRFDKRIDDFRIHPELQKSRRNVIKQKSEQFNPPARVCDVARIVCESAPGMLPVIAERSIDDQRSAQRQG